MERPKRWTRVQVLLRLGVLLCLAVVGAPIGYLFGVFYVALPVVAALLVSQKGGSAYLADAAPRIARAMYWWNAVLAYLLFLTDRIESEETLPDSADQGHFRFQVAFAGPPTVGRALLRWLTSLPELIVLAVLWSVGGIVLLIAAVCVLVVERVPNFALGYLQFLLVFQARLLAYHASLVEAHALWPELKEQTPIGTA